VVTADDIRALAGSLPRSTEVFVRGRIKFRVGSIVWLAFSRDLTEMGLAFPKEWRQALVESRPETFSMPTGADLKYHWVDVRLDTLEPEEMRDYVLDAWAMVVPQFVVDEYVARMEKPRSRGASR
jgi:hypothetical protein